MKNSKLLFLIPLVLIVYISSNGISITSAYDRDSFEDPWASTSGSDEERGMQRAIGFKGNKAPSNVTTKKPYPFSATSNPNWRSQPGEVMQNIAKVYNDTDPIDNDYYASYDFEFAKGGIDRQNFDRKNRESQLSAKNFTDPQHPGSRSAGQGGEGKKPTTTTKKPSSGILIGLTRALNG